MDQNKTTMRLQAVVNTLNATMLRADQVEAMQRINACTHELMGIIKDLETKAETEKGCLQ